MLVTTGIYWLFYSVKILDRTNIGLESAILFSKSSVETLMYIHLAAIIIQELRLSGTNNEHLFLVEVIRSTDGEFKFYNLNGMTIQEAAYFILQNYYKDFPLNNPAAYILGNVSSKRKNLNNSSTMLNTKANIDMSKADFKIYNLDGTAGNKNDGNGTNQELDGSVLEQSKKVLATASARSRKRENEQNATDRYYDQLEWERHTRKRKCRLELAAEKAFDKITRYENYSRRNQNQTNIMDANEAATVLFPSIARSLQKYLRTTRQHLHYSLASTTTHLSDSFKNGLSYRAFLQRYFKPRPNIAYPAAAGLSDTLDNNGELSEWTLSSENALTDNIFNNCSFILNCCDFSLVIHCYQHPRISLRESLPSKVKFTLKV